jgi:hypothetical protein
MVCEERNEFRKPNGSRAARGDGKTGNGRERARWEGARWEQERGQDGRGKGQDGSRWIAVAPRCGSRGCERSVCVLLRAVALLVRCGSFLVGRSPQTRHGLAHRQTTQMTRATETSVRVHNKHRLGSVVPVVFRTREALRSCRWRSGEAPRSRSCCRWCSGRGCARLTPAVFRARKALRSCTCCRRCSGRGRRSGRGRHVTSVGCV